MPPTPQRTIPPRPTGTPPRRIESSDNVLDRIEDIDTGLDKGRSFLFYGDSGSGKTTLWSSFPKPILVVICSGGQEPGELLSINTSELKKVIKRVVLRAPSELDTITKAVSDGALVHPETQQPFKTIVLDHVSGFQDLKLAAFKNLREIPQQKSFGIATKQDWGEISSQVKEHLVKLLSLRCNKVIIAQERVFMPYSDDEKMEKKEVLKSINLSDVIKPKVGAALIPAITGWLNPACDYVVQTYIREAIIEEEEETKHMGKVVKKIVQRKQPGVIQFCARTAKHEIFMTKFRTTAALVGGGEPLPECIVLGDTVRGVYKPDGYTKIMALINKGLM